MTGTRRCRSCAAPLSAGDVFCEACGARLGDGRTADANTGDRTEVDLGALAAVSDRGRVHRRNEDAFRVELIGANAVAVICDGISTASAGDAAARSAADAAAALLTAGLQDPEADCEAVILTAIQSAHHAVALVPWTARVGRSTPSCTLVCAMVRDGEVAVGSIGDSRAYWVDEAGARQLTVDDSWAGEQVAAGHLTEAQAMADSRAHAITHWVGSDAPARPPRVTRFGPERAGRLLLCSDGLWNYLVAPAELVALVAALPPSSSPGGIARALTDTALERGGRDNITVAVAEVQPPPRRHP